MTWNPADLWDADLYWAEHSTYVPEQLDQQLVKGPRWRYIAQDILSGTFLHTDLPLRREELRWDLSGPGALRGTITPVRPGLIISGEPILQEWKTAIYAEADGEIRWGGILINSSFNGGAWQIECAGFASYPNGIPYTGELYSKIDFDPTQIFVDIWAHVQSQPDGNLNVTIDRGGGSPIRVGTPAQVATAGVEASDAEPYELAWWESTDCGSELDQLSRETPFDYIEEHAWLDETITHKIRLSFPRHGATRYDLSFVQGANVTRVVEADRNGSDFANILIGLGKGEGAARIRQEIPERDGRLRRPFVYSDSTIDTNGRMIAISRREHTARSLKPRISSITVRDHANAPFGSWRVGDDIRIMADLQWLGWTEMWCRITSWALETESTAVLSVARSDSFIYGGQPTTVKIIEALPDYTGGEGAPPITGTSGYANLTALADAYPGLTLAHIAADYVTLIDIDHG